MSSGKKPAKREPLRQQERYCAYKELSINYEGYSEEISIRVPDLSPRGIFINTARRFAEGSILKIRFRLTRSNYEVNLRGEVRYCLPGVGVGVEFVEIPPDTLQAIEEELMSINALPPR
jgi:hypothetical protein